MDYYKYEAYIDSQINLESVSNFNILTSFFSSVLGKIKILIHLFILIKVEVFQDNIVRC